jgi:hypothetical protein
LLRFATRESADAAMQAGQFRSGIIDLIDAKERIAIP